MIPVQRVISRTWAPMGTTGIFFYGFTPAAYPLGEGTLCIGYPDLNRIGVTQASAAGTASMSIDTAALAAAGQIAPGSVIQIQHWYRDVAAGASGFNLSDAIQVLFDN